MSKNQTGLGEVDAFGLDQLGQPVGLNPVWGAAVGAGLGTVGAIGVRRLMPQYEKHSELIGFGLGAGASAAMLAFEGTRAAGWTGLASAFLNNGLRSLERMFFMPPAEKAAEEAMKTTAAAVERMAAGEVSGVVIDPSEVLEGVVINRTEALGAAPLPTLVGNSLSGHFGSTVISP